VAIYSMGAMTDTHVCRDSLDVSRGSRLTHVT